MGANSTNAIINMVPEVFDKISSLFAKDKAEKTEDTEEKVD